MNKKTFVAVLIAVFILVAVAVLYKLLTAVVKKEKESIKIAVSTWPGWSHVFLARDKGFFKKNNVDVELIHRHEHPNAEKLFLNGDADGMFQTLADTIFQNVQLLSSKVV